MSNDELEAGKIISQQILPPKVRTETEALNYLEDLYTAMVQKRSACMISIPGDKITTQKLQSKAFTAYLIHHGSVLGSLAMAHAAGLISDQAYSAFREKTLGNLTGMVTGLI